MAYDTLCCFVGGLGENRFTHGHPSPMQQVQAACPNALCIAVDDIGYIVGKVPDITAIILAQMQNHPTIGRVVVADHSMGWRAGADAALKGVVDYLIALDAVGTPFVSEDTWPHRNGIKQAGSLWKANPTPFIQQMGVINGPPIRVVDCSHNEIPARAEVISAIIKAV